MPYMTCVRSVRSKGSVVFQLRSVDLPGLQDAGVQFVYGVAKVSGGEKLQLPQGAGDRFVKDLYYPIQGKRLLGEHLMLFSC